MADEEMMDDGDEKPAPTPTPSDDGEDMWSLRLHPDVASGFLNPPQCLRGFNKKTAPINLGQFFSG